MVYSGTPSRGCHTCRLRKIRCDQNPAGCSQCLNSRRECPGYREQPAFIFRDESQKVARKSKARTPATSGSSLPASSTQSSRRLSKTVGFVRIQSPLVDLGLRPLLPRHVPVTIDDQALAFFLSKFVLGADGPTEGHFERLCHIDWTAKDHLTASMKAVGFVGLSGALQDPRLLTIARKQYTRAVRSTNVVLKSAEQVKDDSTLLAVLTLSLFERLAGSDKSAYIDFGKHVYGAAAVLRTRGPEQMRTPEGQKLFIQTTASLIAYCMQEDIHLPTIVLELSEKASLRSNPSPSIQVLHHAIRFTEFNASVKQGTLTDPIQIVSEALSLERDFEPLFLATPKGWTYVAFQKSDSDPLAVYCGHYHVYDSFWVSRMWNVYRIVKLSLHAIIRHTLLSCDGFDFELLGGEEQLQASTETIAQMQLDIISSVPEHLGFGSGRIKSTSRTNTPDFNTPESSSVSSRQLSPYTPVNSPISWPDPRKLGLSGGNSIIFPLYKAGMVDLDDESRERKLWCIQRLKYVGREVGIQQALNLASLLDNSMAS